VQVLGDAAEYLSSWARRTAVAPLDDLATELLRAWTNTTGRPPSSLVVRLFRHEGSAHVLAEPKSSLISGREVILTPQPHGVLRPIESRQPTAVVANYVL